MAMSSVILPIAGLVTLALVKYMNMNAGFELQGKNQRGRDIFAECAMLMEPEILDCCTMSDLVMPSDEMLAELRQCNKYKEVAACEPDLCKAKVLNIVNDDGTMNKTALEDLVLDRFPENPLNYVMTCVNGDTAYYDDTPNKALCELTKGCGAYDVTTNPSLCTDLDTLSDTCTRVFPSQLFSYRKGSSSIHDVIQDIYNHYYIPITPARRLRG